MKIYFAGSIRGGRQDAALYRRIIARCREYGTVLTEHVGDPSLSVLEQGKAQDGAIYRQDTAWIREADLLVCEATNPSLGVGYELCYAEHRGIPCLVFYNRARCQLSAMIKGDPYFRIFPYEREEELFGTLAALLSGREAP
ncbi:MAG: nucleoside 2-deoxyribosyltransferase [Lachnospiraceae bacterium]|nr:nucleoside 2-deoxyribosyltransferase [Lachnospiraceae bacterium]